jgi:hypothetical protein
MAGIQDFVGGSILDGVKKVIGAFKTDPTVKAQLEAQADEHAAEYKLAELQLNSKIQDHINEQVLAMQQVNLAEAQSNDKFKSRWRPLIGYICALGLFYQTFALAMITWLSGIIKVPPPPPLDVSTLLTVLLGMLGLAKMRSDEKQADKD